MGCVIKICFKQALCIELELANTPLCAVGFVTLYAGYGLVHSQISQRFFFSTFGDMFGVLLQLEVLEGLFLITCTCSRKIHSPVRCVVTWLKF